MGPQTIEKRRLRGALRIDQLFFTWPLINGSD